MKKFTKFEQAAIKSTAKQVYRFYEQKAALDRKVEEFKKKIELQKAQVDQTIDAFESSVKFMSGGFTTKDLCVTEMVDGKRRFTMKPQEVLDMLDNPSLAEPAGEVFADEPVPADVPPMPGLEDAPADESEEEPLDIELPVEDTAKKEGEEEEEGETDEFSDEEDSDEDESDEDDEDEDEEDEDFDDDEEDEDEDADEDDEEPVAEEDVFDII
jgi:hypothetical protein